jgi:hypothetical protein
MNATPRFLYRFKRQRDCRNWVLHLLNRVEVRRLIFDVALLVQINHFLFTIASILCTPHSPKRQDSWHRKLSVFAAPLPVLRSHSFASSWQ